MFFNHIKNISFTSKILAKNPLGNPIKRSCSVLLPYEYSAEKKFPTFWFLDGYLGNGHSMLKDVGALGESFPEMLLRCQNQGVCPHFIGVFPDCSTALGGSQYINSLANGRFLDHLVDELVPLIDSLFSTDTDPNTRVLLGHSSGGFGAFVAGLLKPGVFGSIVASAMDSAFENSMASGFATTAQVLLKEGGIDGFLKKMFSQRNEKLSTSDFTALMTIAMASCYSPEIGENSAHAKLPFDVNDLTFKPEVWQKWLDWDPVSLVKIHFQQLAGLRHLHLDCGKSDECGAQFGHRRIKKTLDENRINHTYTEFNGGHYGTQYRYEERLRLLGLALRSS